MLTDATPRKANRAAFLESDRDQNPRSAARRTIAGHCKIPRIGNEGWSYCGCPPRLRRLFECRIGVLQSPCLWHPRACSKAAPSPRELEHRAFRGLHPRSHVDPGMEADGSAQGSHVVRYIPKHALPRVLPSSRFSEVRVPRLMAHAGILWAGCRVIPPCARNTAERALLGARDRRSLANRLATDESQGRCLWRCYSELTSPPFC